jgi:site-specific DNA-methyltransferase (adenine-specific)
MSWKLFEGDCLKIMPDFEDKSFDMILCDLPYGTTACKWDTIIPLEPLWLEYKRIIKDNGAIVLFGSQPFTSKLVMSNPEMFRYEWIWDKGAVTGFLDANKKPLKQHENILVFYKSLPSYNPIKWESCSPQRKGRIISSTKSNLFSEYSKSNWDDNGERYPTSFIYVPKERNNQFKHDLKHPSQKPTQLYEYLIKTYTNEQDTILDNTAGSGTLGVACQNLNRNAVMIEQDPNYCNTIRERMVTTEDLVIEQRKQQTLTDLLVVEAK